MTGLLVFDGDCAFCTSAARFADRWLRATAEMVPWQLADLEALGLTEVACQQSVHYRNQAGRWTCAGRAIAELMREARAPWPWLGALAELPGISRLVDLVYVWIAANRYRLPGGTPACKATDRET